MSVKIPKFTFRLLKLAVFCLLISAIYRQLAVNHNFLELWEDFQFNWDTEIFFYFLIVLLLMPVNLNLEALKWQKLILKIEHVPPLRAFSAICSGITLSMFTPNRVGEFGGRVLLLRKASKIQGAAISLVGSLSQLVASFSIGFLGLVGFLLLYKVVSVAIAVTLLGAGIMLVFLLSFFYFNNGLLHTLLLKSEKFKKYAVHLNPLLSFSNADLLNALSISLARHLVFSLQYILIFWCLGIGVSAGFANMFILVLSIFFVQTVFPSIALIELGVRSSIAIYFMENIGANPLEVIVASLLLWSINLMIPSVIGLGVLLRLNFRKSLFSVNNEQ